MTINTFMPSSCIWDKDQDQAQKNVILGSSSDPRIRIKFWDQDQGEKLGSRLILILIPNTRTGP